MVEKYNQTLKHKIFNGLLRNKNKKWLDDLASYVENINTAKQSVTKEAPTTESPKSSRTEKEITTHAFVDIQVKVLYI